MPHTVKIALHTPTGKFMHIDKAENGSACNCECIKCGEELEAIQGEIREKHFRHATNKDCDGAQEAALRELGKQLLVESNKINLPNLGKITYSNPIAEKKLNGYRPDVAVQLHEQPLYFDVFVSDSINNNKESYVKRYGLNCIEIDLSSNLSTSFNEIRNKIFDNLDNKRIIHWKTVTPTEVLQNNKYLIGAIASSAFVFFGLARLLRKK